ncbi:UDP-glucuronosyl/UDP-glucosyltransferase [Sesbania bispinosa]|nr:UDP-glucuronosyl/UDP-glucosyltransferase [Sesbania bispinosa]
MEQFEIPCACLWIQPCALYAIYYRFYNNLNQFPTLADPEMSTQLPVTKVLAEMFQDMKKLKWVLANSFYELEKEVIDSMAQICPINRLMHGMAHPSASIFGYICFLWKLIVLSDKQMESIANALKKSNRPFLWVIKRPDGAASLSLHRGSMKRPKTEAWWCHGVRKQGTPMIAYPQWTDQPTNAKLISEVFQMGIRLKQDSDGFVVTEEVERAIEEIVEGPTSEALKKNALRLKQAAREAVAERWFVRSEYPIICG